MLVVSIRSATRVTAVRSIAWWSNASADGRRPATATQAAASASPPARTSGTRIRPNKRVVSHRDDAHAGVSACRTERAELLQVDVPAPEARLFLELADGGGVEVLALLLAPFTDAHEAPGKRPRPLERMLGAANEEHAELRVDHGHRDDVHRDRRPRVVRRAVLAEELRLGDGLTPSSGSSGEVDLHGCLPGVAPHPFHRQPERIPTAVPMRTPAKQSARSSGAWDGMP